jgi:hypothetical protein
MKLRSLFVISAILGAVLGLGFFFVPKLVMSTFGIDAGGAHQHTARNFGSAMIGLAIISWVARNSKNSIARRAIILGLCFYFIFGSISIISFQIIGNVNHFGWIIIALHLLLLGGFAYNLIMTWNSKGNNKL